MNRVPDGEPVITHDFVYPHVAARETVDIFREGARPAKWMILAPFVERGKASGPGSVEQINQSQIRPRLGAYLPVSLQDGWLVLRLRQPGEEGARGALDGRACAGLRARAARAPAWLGASATVAALCVRR